MEITQNAPDSASVLVKALRLFVEAGAGLVHIRTREPLRAATILRKFVVSGDALYSEWDVVNGIRNRWTGENYINHVESGGKEDFVQALEMPLNHLRDSSSDINKPEYARKTNVYSFVCPGPFIANNPMALELIQQYAAILSATNICIMLITPDMPLPDVPVGLLSTTELPTPTVAELTEALNRLLGEVARDGGGTTLTRHELSADDVGRAALMGLGLTELEFESSASLTILEADAAGMDTLTPDYMLQGIAKGKTDIVRQSEILELIPTVNMDDVAGMRALKSWVLQRANCFSDEAKAYGIEPPKGAVLVGVPGVGKSLAARATAASLGVPLVKMDISRVFSKFVGESEGRMAMTLKMVERMAPCVLFVDEVDKALGGAEGSSGDSGTSSRVLGGFLTWLQDNKAPVFTLMTANRVDNLPPELMRRGRFDAIFSSGMPGSAARLECLGIHLRKRGYDINSFDATELARFGEATTGYVHAEIEAAVKDALIAAFGDESPGPTMDHIVAAIHAMVPQSKTFADRINRIVAWAKDNATDADGPAATQAATAPVQGTGGRRFRGGSVPETAPVAPVPTRTVRRRV